MLLTRFFLSVLALFLVITLTFSLLRAFPGGPFDDESPTSPAVRAQLEKQYGLGQNVFFQGLKFSIDFFKGDWGRSILYGGRPVREVISEAFPRTLVLGGVSLTVSLGFGLFMGYLFFLTSSAKIVRWIHRFFLSAPTLFLGPLLILVFGIWLGWLPVTTDESIQSFLLPILVLSIRPTANLARLLLSAMEESLLEPWVITAKAMGLSSKVIVLQYALKQSLIPVLTYLGPALAGVLSGSFIVENIFNVQGMGTLFLQSLVNRDYSLIVALTVIYASVLIFANFVFDLINLWVDPRIQSKIESGTS